MSLFETAAPRRLAPDITAGLDPRTRVLAAAMLVVAVVALQSLPALCLALGGALALVALSGQSLAGLGRRLVHVEGFLLVLLVLLPLTTPGTAILQFGPLTASVEGLALAATLVLRIATCVVVVFVLLGRVEPVCLGQALARLGVPAQLVHLLLFVIRYADLFRAEARRLIDAMRGRGFAPQLGGHALRSYGNLAGMLLVRALERAERVDAAMRCRGYSGRLPLGERTAYGRGDLVFGAGAALFAALILAADRLA